MNELLLLGAPLLVTATLLGLALRDVARAWRLLAESRSAEALARLERTRLRRAELEADERERERRSKAPERRPVDGFLPRR